MGANCISVLQSFLLCVFLRCRPAPPLSRRRDLPGHRGSQNAMMNPILLVNSNSHLICYRMESHLILQISYCFTLFVIFFVSSTEPGQFFFHDTDEKRLRHKKMFLKRNGQYELANQWCSNCWRATAPRASQLCPFQANFSLFSTLQWRIIMALCTSDCGGFQNDTFIIKGVHLMRCLGNCASLLISASRD